MTGIAEKYCIHFLRYYIEFINPKQGLEVSKEGIVCDDEALNTAIQSGGFAVVHNTLSRENYTDHLTLFQEVIDEVGRGDLTNLTWTDITGRRGGKFGFKRRVDEGITGPESKDSFMFRTGGDRYIDGSKMPGVLVEYLGQGFDIMSDTSAAIRTQIKELDKIYSGIYELHYGDPCQVDENMRVLLYDERSTHNEFVAEPHLDISSFTLHAFDGRTGTFFGVHDGRLIFPSSETDHEAVFFPARWLGQPDMPVKTSMDPLWHGAINGKRGDQDESRRGVVVHQVQPRLDSRSQAPSFSSTHTPAESAIVRSCSRA